MNKILLVLATTLITSVTFAADIEDCSDSVRKNFGQAFSCIYNAPSGCDLEITDAGKVAGMQIIGLMSEANSEFSCEEFDAAGTFALALIQKL